MFTDRELTAEVAAVRDAHAPDVLVLDCARDFETLPPAQAEELGLVTESLEPASYPAEWLPDDAPDLLRQYASDEFTVGAPGDGGVAWTHQTTPPVVLVKPRLAGSPDAFVDFLLAEALVEVGLELPEHFLGFFGERYRDLARAVADRLDPVGTYQLAAALYTAYLGLHTREVFAGWDGEQPGQDARPALHDAWVDAGERLEPRLADLPSDLAAGSTDFGDAAELACSAVKHTVGQRSTSPRSHAREDGIDLPTPFGALDTAAYREHGADFAVQWAEKTFDRLD